MNNRATSVSVSSPKTFLDLGRSIRDTIFYYEDLMGDNSAINKEVVKVTNPMNEVDVFMAEIFDEVMINNQVRIESKEREHKIKQLLHSIETFHADGFGEE